MNDTPARGVTACPRPDSLTITLTKDGHVNIDSTVKGKGRLILMLELALKQVKELQHD